MNTITPKGPRRVVNPQGTRTPSHGEEGPTQPKRLTPRHRPPAVERRRPGFRDAVIELPFRPWADPCAWEEIERIEHPELWRPAA